MKGLRNYMELKHLFIKWAYNNTHKDFFKANKEKINQLNTASLNTLNDVAVIMFSILCIYSKLTNDFAGLFNTYFVYFIIFLMINLLCKHVQHYDYIISNHFLYIVIALIYIFGIYIGCFNITNLASVMFPVFLICLPLVFIMPMFEINLFNVFFITIFLYFSRKFKADTIVLIDQANIFACLIISAVTSYTVNCARIKEISATLKLESACDTDELTNLHNRRSFNKFIVTIFDKTSADQLTLMMIDVDNFKDYNDSYGHLCGDNCLVSVGNVFKEIENKYGCYIARYGGEEFVLVDYTHPLPEAVSIAKELIQIISDTNIEHIKSNYRKITISIGVSTKLNPSVTNYIDLINLADDALYQAKSNGKNTLMVATHSASCLRMMID